MGENKSKRSRLARSFPCEISLKRISARLQFLFHPWLKLQKILRRVTNAFSVTVDTSRHARCGSRRRRAAKAVHSQGCLRGTPRAAGLQRREPAGALLARLGANGSAAPARHARMKSVGPNTP